MAEVFVAGAGRIGVGIAQLLAENGISVCLYDNADPKKKWEQYLSKLSGLAQDGKISRKKLNAVTAGVFVSSDLNSARESNFVLEAIRESFEEKSSLFSILNTICDSTTIFCSATASLSIAALGSASGRSDRFAGMQFFPPVPLIDLCEITPSLNTSEKTLNKLKGFADRIQKKSIVSRDFPGFTVNRQVIPVWNEAFYMIQDGVLPEDIDSAMRLATEAHMGPLQLADYVGLDLVLSVMQTLYSVTKDEKYHPCPLLSQMVEDGKLGCMCGQGVYTYGC